MKIAVFVLVGALVVGCNKDNQTNQIQLQTMNNKIIFGNKSVQLEIDSHLRCRVGFKKTDKYASLNHTEETVLPTHFLKTGTGNLTDFDVNFKQVKLETINSAAFGVGKRLIVPGKDSASGIDINLSIELFEDHPRAVLFQANYTNSSIDTVHIAESVSNYFLVNASLVDANVKPNDMWSFQGIAHAWGTDYILPLETGFERENYFGFQEDSRMGGGVPMIDVWSREMGLAIACVEKMPTILSFPTKVLEDGRTEISIKQTVNKPLAPGAVFSTPRTTAIVHALDFYEPLANFASLMKDQGLYMKEPSPETYEPFWCSWGYESDFTQQDVYNVLPKLNELNIKWIVIDDRWFDRYGDWNPRKETFPGGERQLKAFVDSLHRKGFLVKIWWVPMLAQPEAPPPNGKWPSTSAGSSKLVANHPEWLVKDEHGDYARCPRNMHFLNGSLPDVQHYIKGLTYKFINDWGFDGHKLDAYWVVPPSYDSLTADPILSYQTVPSFIQTIYETSKMLKPYSVTEICNCGVPQDFYQSVYTDQPVVADPTSFSQVRRRIKLNKALWGPKCPVFGDHVEHIKISEDRLGTDFASTIGTGGVPGTKFTWPQGPKRVQLTAGKEQHWKKWLDIYRSTMLSKGDYTNLYDVAFDKPEGHVIRKDGKQYYAFYAEDWHGEIEIRGLEDREYLLRDYVNNISLGTIKGPIAKVNLDFKEHLLLECTPGNGVR